MENPQRLNLTAKAWFEKGRRLVRDGRHSEAMDAFDQSIAEAPDFAEAYFARGACCYALGSYHQAADDIDAAAILGCRDAQYWSKYATQPPPRKDEDEEE